MLYPSGGNSAARNKARMTCKRHKPQHSDKTPQLNSPLFKLSFAEPTGKSWLAGNGSDSASLQRDEKRAGLEKRLTRFSLVPDAALG